MRAEVQYKEPGWCKVRPRGDQRLDALLAMNVVQYQKLGALLGRAKEADSHSGIREFSLC